MVFYVNTALFLVLGVFAIEDGAPLHLWVGLVQRIVVAVWFIWTRPTKRIASQ